MVKKREKQKNIGQTKDQWRRKEENQEMKHQKVWNFFFGLKKNRYGDEEKKRVEEVTRKRSRTREKKRVERKRRHAKTSMEKKKR